MNNALKLPEINNILADIPTQLPKELSSCLLQSDKVLIERIVSRGQASVKNEWYDQPHEEWVLLLRGCAILEFFGQSELKKLQEGDYLLIPANCKHRVEWTDPNMDSIWLAIHVK